MVSAYMLLMSLMLQLWMKLMVLMLLMMSNLTIMTMMMILMMIRPGEGGTFFSEEGSVACFQKVSTRFFVEVVPAVMVAKPKVDHLLKWIVYSVGYRTLVGWWLGQGARGPKTWIWSSGAGSGATRAGSGATRASDSDLVLA